MYARRRSEPGSPRPSGHLALSRDGAALRQRQEDNPGFFAQLDRAMRVPILAGAGAALILRGDTVLVRCR